MMTFDDNLLGSLFSISTVFENYEPYESFNGGGKFVPTKYEKTFNDRSTQRFTDDLFKIGKESFDYLEVSKKDELNEIHNHSFFYIFTIFLKSGFVIKGEEKFKSDQDVLAFLFTTFRRNMYRLLRNKAVEECDKGKSKLLDNLCTDIAIYILCEIDNAFYFIFLDDMESYNKSLIDIVTHRNLLKELSEYKEKSFHLRRQKASFAAKKRHEPMNAAKEKLRAIWASGKYTTKERCAEMECEALKMSYDTARKALRNQ